MSIKSVAGKTCVLVCRGSLRSAVYCEWKNERPDLVAFRYDLMPGLEIYEFVC